MAGRLGRYGLVTATITAWQVTSSSTPGAFPSPIDVLHSFGEWWTSGNLVDDVVASLSRVAGGYAIAVTAGTSLGVVMGAWPRMARQLAPLIELLRPIPPIAWIPLALIWFGISDTSSAFIVFLGAFFPILIATHAGIQAEDADVINTAKSLGIQGWLLVVKVRAAAAMPSIFIGLRTALGVAWMSLIAAELVGASSGLGYRIQIGRLLLSTERVMAAMLLIGLLGFLMNQLLLFAGRRAMPWNRALAAAPHDGILEPSESAGSDSSGFR